MSDTIQIKKDVFRLLKEDLQRSVENLPSSGKGIELVDIDDHSLTAMMVLLRFHPDNQTAKLWNDRILEKIKNKAKANQMSGGRPPTHIYMPKYSNDPYMEAVNLIAEYGQFLIELRGKRAAEEQKQADGQKQKKSTQKEKRQKLGHS